ncbi:MAG: MerR family transcriptional regulator [Porphyromonas sp.]|nr:MerR family transcriptional regulator [Porphyromonas sp.]
MFSNKKQHINWKEDGGTKICVSIGELARMYGVTESVLRYWEKCKLVSPRKSPNGTRYYHKKDVERVDRIYHLVHEQGFTVEAARRKLAEKPDRDGKNVVQKLIEIQADIDALIEQCDYIIEKAEKAEQP